MRERTAYMKRWRGYIIYGAITAVLFSFSVALRANSFLDARIQEKRPPLAFSLLGVGSDHEYQLYCASKIINHELGETLTHYDYLFLCPILALIYSNTTFINGSIIIAVIEILLGGLVSLFPFLLFSSPKRISIVSVLCSMVLIFNKIMIENSDTRFFIYPLVSYHFIICMIVLLKAIEKKTLFWYGTFALVSVLQSLSKPFLYVNDIPFILLFSGSLFFESAGFRVPFLKFSFTKDRLQKAIVMLSIFFVVAIAFEIFHHHVTKIYFFLSDLFIDTGLPSTKEAVLGNSLGYTGPALQKFKNILALLYLCLYQFYSYAQLKLLLLVGIFAIIVTHKNPIRYGIFSLLTFFSGLVFLLTVGDFFLLHNQYVVVTHTSFWDYWNASLVFAFLVTSTFKNKVSFLLTSSHIFYLLALAMTLSSVDQSQLFVTLIIWIVILLCYHLYQIEWFFQNFSYRVQALLVLIGLLLFKPAFVDSLTILSEGIERTRMEVRYLKWVRSTAVPDAFILANGAEHLLLVANVTKLPTYTNALYVSRRVTLETTLAETWEKADFERFGSLIEDSAQTGRVIILDHNLKNWEYFLRSGASQSYPKDKYEVKEVASSPYLDRKIYTLVLKEK